MVLTLNEEPGGICLRFGPRVSRIFSVYDSLPPSD